MSPELTGGLPDGREVVVHRERFDVWNEVPLVPQTTGMSCWAAAAAMIVGWRDALSVDPEQIARGAGRWSAYVEGLVASDVEALARAWDLVVEPPVNWSVGTLRTLLETYGPMWVGEASPGLHALVVTGIHGDGTPEKTFVRINDPWPIDRGERYSLVAERFLSNLARATDAVGAHAQVLRSRGRRAGSSRFFRVDETHTYRTAPVSAHPRRAREPAPDPRMPPMSYDTTALETRLGYPALSRPLGAVAAGERVIQSSSIPGDPLRSHLGTADNIYVRWNAMSDATPELDVVIYLHGYSSGAPNERTLRAKAASSGMDPTGRTRPTLVIVPRGRKITDAEYQAAFQRFQQAEAAWTALAPDVRAHRQKPNKPRSDAYRFPGLIGGSGQGLTQLVRGVVAWFSNAMLGSRSVSIPRCILAAHSGGGAALEQLLSFRASQPACNPQEVYVFDALYGPAPNLEAWLVERVAADRLGGRPGALRIFAGAGTASSSRHVKRQIPGTADSARYQVESTTQDHGDIPGAYGPSLLRDAGFTATRVRALELIGASYGDPGDRPPPEPVPSWLEAGAEVREHGERFDAPGPFVVRCVDAIRGRGVGVVGAIEVTANAAQETGWGRHFRANNLGGWTISRAFASSYRQRTGQPAPWWRAPGHVDAGDRPWMYYRAFPSVDAFLAEWLTTFVPKAGTSTGRYRATGEAFWSGNPWFGAMIEAGYKGERTRAHPESSIHELESIARRVRVLYVQSKLGIPATGRWRDASREALRAFQRARGIPDTGEIDTTTLERLAAGSAQGLAYGSVDGPDAEHLSEGAELAPEPDAADVAMALSNEEPEAHEEAMALGLAVPTPPRVGRTLPSVEAISGDRALVFTTTLPTPPAVARRVASPPDDDYRAVFAWCPTQTPLITWVHFHGDDAHVVEASGGKRRPTWDDLPGPGRARVPLDNTWEEHQYGRAVGSALVPDGLRSGVLALLPECARPATTRRGVLAKSWHGQFSAAPTLRAVLSESVAQLTAATKVGGGTYLAASYDLLQTKRLVVSAHSGGGSPLLEALAADLLQPGALKVGEREIGLDVWLFDCTYPFGAWATAVDALVSAWRAAGRLGNRPGGLRFVCVDIPVEWQHDASGQLVKTKPSGTRAEADHLRRTLLPKFAPDVANVTAEPRDRMDPTTRAPRPAFLGALDHGVVFCRTQQTEHSPCPQTFIPYLLRTAKI